MDEGDFINKSHGQLLPKLSNLLAQHILPLFAEGNRHKPQLVGSGFLVASGTSSYLISAAHVFDNLMAGHDLFFYIDSKTTRKLSGTLRLTKMEDDGNRKSDPFDIGVLKLEGPALPPYMEIGKSSLPLSALMGNVLPREEKEYLLIGFPESKSRVKNPALRSLESEPYAFRGVSAPATTYSALGISPLRHIMLEFNVKRVYLPNGNMITFPEPKGMSGSPIWLLADHAGQNDPAQTPVVGVAIEHHKNQRAILATDINIALKLINEQAF